MLESQPGGEGRTLASELRGAGIKARWVRDRSRRIAVRDSDLVVIGADTVERDGSVVHKVGTRALAREALRRQVPVVVVAGSSKWVPEFSRSGPLPRLFDRTPARWIAQYWTDQGRRPGRSRIPIQTRHQRDEVPAPPRRRRRPDPGRRDGSGR